MSSSPTDVASMLITQPWPIHLKLIGTSCMVSYIGHNTRHRNLRYFDHSQQKNIRIKTQWSLLATWLFIESLFRLTTKKSSKVLITGLCEGNRHRPVYLHKETVMLKVCSCHYNTISTLTWWRHQMETFSALMALFCGEFNGHRWIPHTKARDAELWCFLCSAPE